ncbi:MOSC domain-containing protein [Mucilaginibacter sp. UR6-11]|uniref:MOSC domain-containing protein n=1 Tax=Mucilaginibacter sp. UR6-11 TaxID=1435644 RepID=UPI001E551E2F|nr:MOSC N-terminal beta barrel domain-containing protein [Mucilaginibacter sp. UR6-11]MCC8426197.1 MOSC domain-containing protein [Mucilaginibacter sp. UR6-11]
MLRISELYIYPVKSLGGIQLNKATVTDRGFKYDRRWMLIDENNRFISQREHAIMALFNTSISAGYLTVTYSGTNHSINLSLTPVKENVMPVTIWDDTCLAQPVSDEADEWFSRLLGINVRLVFMPDDTRRVTDPQYAPADSITSFSDAYPFLMIGRASLDDLNQRLKNSLPMNRFRPNIVFTGGQPYQEDTMDKLTINNIVFNGVKLCARCNIITINQSDASIAKEPVKTLASYRARNNKIYFGQNLVHSGTGIIAVGDELTVLTTHDEPAFII